jgi:tetratricopeptide (TPR) repeat protein
VLESAIEDFPLFKKDLTQMEATVFNNMAACCRKELNSKAEIEWSTKVIDRQEFISDKTVLLKAFLRRGLAYEQIEKYLQAKEDMLSVKELNYDNKQASQCLNRVQKAIKDIYGNKVPEVQKNKPIKLATGSDNSPKKESSPAASP